ncbi:hypothetical protein CFK58_05290, partial [Streptococcus agalactiae]
VCILPNYTHVLQLNYIRSSIICMFIYLLISSIILIFIIFGCSFLVFLTLELSTFERKRIINKLIKEVEIK